MNNITAVVDSDEQANELKIRLGQYFETQCIQLDNLAEVAPGEVTVVDVDLKDSAQLSHLMRWLRNRPMQAQVVFGVDKRSHFESIQAYAIGATGLLPRPIDGKRLASMLAGGKGSVAKNGSELTNATRNGIAASVNALQKVFAAAMLGETVDVATLNSTASVVVEKIEEDGLASCLESLREYHSQTYQHCLIVTAVAVSFGRCLGFSTADRQRLATAGLLHDIGKAQIPIDILEKPSPLSDDETAIMRTHAELGYRLLHQQKELPVEMLDMVLHHHEYLDGSGYPHGLRGNQITDLVRTMTIADVYGALIERRPYRRPMTGPAAYQILIEMGSKLDKDLVRVFRPLAQSIH